MANLCYKSHYHTTASKAVAKPNGFCVSLLTSSLWLFCCFQMSTVLLLAQSRYQEHLSFLGEFIKENIEHSSCTALHMCSPFLPVLWCVTSPRGVLSAPTAFFSQTHSNCCNSVNNTPTTLHVNILHMKSLTTPLQITYFVQFWCSVASFYMLHCFVCFVCVCVCLRSNWPKLASQGCH